MDKATIFSVYNSLRNAVGSRWRSDACGGRLCHACDMIQGSDVQFHNGQITLAMIAESAESMRCPLTPRRQCVSRDVQLRQCYHPAGTLPSVEVPLEPERKSYSAHMHL